MVRYLVVILGKQMKSRDPTRKIIAQLMNVESTSSSCYWLLIDFWGGYDNTLNYFDPSVFIETLPQCCLFSIVGV